MKYYKIAAALIQQNDKILLVKEKYEGHSFWSIPSGKLEMGETYEQAAKRETKEETGIILKGHGKHIYICDYQNKEKQFQCHVEAFVFYTNTTICLPEESHTVIEDAAFFAVDEAIRKLEALADYPMIKDPIIAYLKTKEINRRWRYSTDKDDTYQPCHVD